MADIVDLNDIDKPRGRGRPRKEVVEPTEPKEQKKRGRPKQENPYYKTKEYRRELYQKHQQEIICECCGKVSKNLDCLKAHQKKNKACFILQIFSNENIKEYIESNINLLDHKVESKYKKLLEVRKENN
jgi:hypothetical protein